MSKSPPDYSDGLYHVVIPIEDLMGAGFDPSTTVIRPVAKDEAESLIALFQDIGRNQPCPCGSGVKYKKCCLRRAH